MPKSSRTTAARLLIGLCALHAFAPPSVLAYIDPVSGSLILQAIVAGLLGALLCVKRVSSGVKSTLLGLWRRLTK